jgi:hypothetical protein
MSAIYREFLVQREIGGSSEGCGAGPGAPPTPPPDIHGNETKRWVGWLMRWIGWLLAEPRAGTSS